MEANTDLQIVPLGQLEQGQFMTVILTGATAGGASCVLEIKHANDTVWAADPNFNGTITNGILMERVKCLSAHSRISFVSNPSGTPYWISLVWDAVPQF